MESINSFFRRSTFNFARSSTRGKKDELVDEKFPSLNAEINPLDISLYILNPQIQVGETMFGYVVVEGNTHIPKGSIELIVQVSERRKKGLQYNGDLHLQDHINVYKRKLEKQMELTKLIFDGEAKRNNFQFEKYYDNLLERRKTRSEMSISIPTRNKKRRNTHRGTTIVRKEMEELRNYKKIKKSVSISMKKGFEETSFAFERMETKAKTIADIPPEIQNIKGNQHLFQKVNYFDMAQIYEKKIKLFKFYHKIRDPVIALLPISIRIEEDFYLSTNYKLDSNSIVDLFESKNNQFLDKKLVENIVIDQLKTTHKLIVLFLPDTAKLSLRYQEFESFEDELLYLKKRENCFTTSINFDVFSKKLPSSSIAQETVSSFKIEKVKSRLFGCCPCPSRAFDQLDIFSYLNYKYYMPLHTPCQIQLDIYLEEETLGYFEFLDVLLVNKSGYRSYLRPKKKRHKLNVKEIEKHEIENQKKKKGILSQVTLKKKKEKDQNGVLKGIIKKIVFATRLSKPDKEKEIETPPLYKDSVVERIVYSKSYPIENVLEPSIKLFHLRKGFLKASIHITPPCGMTTSIVNCASSDFAVKHFIAVYLSEDELGLQNRILKIPICLERPRSSINIVPQSRVKNYWNSSISEILETEGIVPLPRSRVFVSRSSIYA